jgi:PAS domain S-box-containing protein
VELEKHREHLEDLVAERTTELERINAQLMAEITDRERTQKQLEKSEARLAQAERIAHLGNWDWNIETNDLAWSDEIYRVFGLTPQQFGATYNAFLSYVHPEDRAFVEQSVNEALYQGKPYSIDHRIVLPSGLERLVHEEGEVTYDESGKPVRMLGTVLDITQHKRVEEELRALSHRLVRIQEEERRAIARELHDEIGQSLTVLRLMLERIAHSPKKGSGSILDEAQSVIKEVMMRVRKLSLELQPRMLDDLGLLPALLWHFERYSAQTQIHTNFQHSGLQRHLPQEVNTAAYRIVQEALTNVARYAEVNEVTIRAWANNDTLCLQIEDDGRGFDPATLANGSSSGLFGMRERALALGGKLTVESAPGKGTQVTAELPISDARKRE